MAQTLLLVPCTNILYCVTTLTVYLTVIYVFSYRSILTTRSWENSVVLPALVWFQGSQNSMVHSVA
jgi:uncharacterized protein involved in response to NO